MAKIPRGLFANAIGRGLDGVLVAAIVMLTIAFLYPNVQSQTLFLVMVPVTVGAVVFVVHTLTQYREDRR